MKIDAGLNILNYHSLPTGAFDANGNVVLPSDFSVPQGWSETVGRVTQSPDFGALLKILGTLTAPKTDWHCWRVAISFSNGTLRVVIVRGVHEVGGDQQVGLSWSGNLWDRVVLNGLKAYAGRQKALPPVLTDALGRVIDAVTGSSYWDRPIADDKVRKTRDDRKWQVTSALGLVRSFVDLVAGLTTSSKVLVTVLWFNAEQGSIEGRNVHWAPLHQLYDGYNVRAVHYWWNSAWDTTNPRTYPFVYGGALRRRGWGVTDVAHQPWELAGAFYPKYTWPDLDEQTRASQPPAPRQVCRRVKTPDGGWEVICLDQPATVFADDAVVVAAAPFDRDVAAFEAARPSVDAVATTPAPDTEDAQEAVEEGVDDVAASGSPAAPLLLAHEPPALGGAFVAEGSLRNGLWVPDATAEHLVPPTVWLRGIGLTAEFDESGEGWRVSAEVPPVVAAAADGLAPD